MCKAVWICPVSRLLSRFACLQTCKGMQRYISFDGDGDGTTWTPSRHWKSWKWTLRQLTGKCEIERIVLQGGGSYGESMRLVEVESHEDKKAKAVAKSVYLSKKMDEVRSDMFLGSAKELFPTFDVESSVHKITGYKNMSMVNESIPKLKLLLSKVLVANVYLSALDVIRRKQYDPASDYKMLDRYWNALYPKQPRKSPSDWKLVGFQGSKPWTDFRGMGMLGLICLVEMVESEPEAVRNVRERFEELSLAIVIINLGSVCFELLQTRRFDEIFFSEEIRTKEHVESRVIEIFLDEFRRVFSRFIQKWALSNRNIMEFNNIIFELKTEMLLLTPSLG
uniref:ELMO domain-containing protein n=1 Tax=Mucochytrium quahogii TaxID=96639 RepID=A0A7S2WPS1_9STRA|mmetsp:Transcript_9424/g.17764  ORF Transcript_9424/g.17764 Transcript_9424/m.17764 type:complete len:337 (+) Transcript_9424:107-1117(+)